jgi:hypothetical protein
MRLTAVIFLGLLIAACIIVIAGGSLLERRRLARLTPEERTQDLLDQQTW